MSLDANSMKADFPILSIAVNKKPLVYLDNAATTQKPAKVIDAIKEYYESYNSNVHRSIHTLSEKATLAHESAREKVARFIGAGSDEIVFTKGTTESMNLLAHSLCANLTAGDEIVLTQMEHHANLVPWQQMAKKYGLKLKFIAITKDGRLDMDDARAQITAATKIVSVIHASNVLGTINPVKKIGMLAHAVGALFIVDGAQSVPHMPIDVKDIDCDFLAFSGHKMLGPMGIGVLFGKKAELEKMEPFLYGGDMILEVTFEGSTWNEVPMKFEAGTPNVAGAIGLGEAVEYLEALSMENVFAHEQELCAYALEKIGAIDGVKIIGPMDSVERLAVVSFIVDGIHPHDVSAIADQDGVAVRGGNHCAQPLMSVLGIAGTTRASFYLYNTKEDVDALCEAIKKAQKVFA